MKIGPKYKIARRLGASVFEKTQTAKFALTAEKKSFSLSGARSRTSFGSQMLEKQRARYSYGISSKQLSNYVKKIIASKVKNPEAELFNALEKRLDNVILRGGFAKTRFQARQIVSHGHVKVNDKKITVPSFVVKKDDKITVRESSRDKFLFSDLNDRAKDVNVPAWLKLEPKEFRITVTGSPLYKPTEVPFNVGEVLQFFKR